MPKPSSSRRTLAHTSDQPLITSAELQAWLSDTRNRKTGGVLSDSLVLPLAEMERIATDAYAEGEYGFQTDLSLAGFPRRQLNSLQAAIEAGEVDCAIYEAYPRRGELPGKATNWMPAGRFHVEHAISRGIRLADVDNAEFDDYDFAVGDPVSTIESGTYRLADVAGLSVVRFTSARINAAGPNGADGITTQLTEPPSATADTNSLTPPQFIALATLMLRLYKTTRCLPAYDLPEWLNARCHRKAVFGWSSPCGLGLYAVNDLTESMDFYVRRVL